MTSTGEKFPTAAATAAESPWLDNDWNTPGNVTADDGNTANCIAASFDSPDQTFVLKATGFDFSSIPDGSTINGVTARVNAWFRSGQGSGSLDLCQLLDTSAAKVGTNQCATPVALTTTTTTIITKGSASDQWGNSLTAAWVKNSNFGIALGVLATAANADVDIDYVTLEIDYTAPVVPNDGEATGAIAWASSATGTTVRSGAGTGAIAWVGSATGTNVHSGVATGAIAWAGSATGEAPTSASEGEATGAITWAGAATGSSVHRGSAAGAISWVGSATGSRVPVGSASGAIGWVGTANGVRSPAGSASGTIGWAGTATGEAPAADAQEN